MNENRSISPDERALLEQHLTVSVRHFVEALYEFRESIFNRAPEINSWSAAQIGSHVIKSMVYIHQVVTGETSEVQRDPEMYVGELKSIMENGDIKSTSADILMPSPDFLMRTQIRQELTAAMLHLITDISTLNLSVLCKAMQFPQIGCLTRYELISFAIYHIERHTRQLANVLQALQAKDSVTSTE